MHTSIVLRACTATLFALSLSSCQSTYFNTMEKFGVHKRDILVDRVSDVRDAQLDAKEQFQSALEQFSSVLKFDGGELEAKYNKLNDAYRDSEDKAEKVRARIESVENVANALFAEWKDELGEYTSDKLRRSSEKKYEQTKRHYKRLLSAMKRAERRIEPVLRAFRDQVLFLKHNLNAKAIASLQGELGSVRSNVATLITEMEASIREADGFIKNMQKNP